MPPDTFTHLLTQPQGPRRLALYHGGFGGQSRGRRRRPDRGLLGGDRRRYGIHTAPEAHQWFLGLMREHDGVLAADGQAGIVGHALKLRLMIGRCDSWMGLMET